MPASIPPLSDPRSILITGASSGLGAALAVHYASPGRTLFLSGRHAGRLDQVGDACQKRGAQVVARTIDVTDQDAMADWVAQCDQQAPLDLVIANAGISAGTGGGAENGDQTRAIFAVNVQGVLNTVLPAMAPMTSRKAGQIAIMASLAGFRGMAGAPAYGASKAAVKSWGEGLRGALAPDGITVSVICPGFVETPMTAVNRFDMPFLMNAQKAAAIMARGLAAGQGRIAYPWPTAFAAWALAAMPDCWADWLTRRLPKK